MFEVYSEILVKLFRRVEYITPSFFFDFTDRVGLESVLDVYLDMVGIDLMLDEVDLANILFKFNVMEIVDGVVLGQIIH